MSTNRPLAAARRPVVAATLLVLAGLVSVFVAFGLAHRSLSASSVQAHELDLAGSQRRLVERIALDVGALRLDPGDHVARAELLRAASRLDQVHEGLLDGSPLLELDGELPDEVRALYAPSGLDLSARLDLYTDAAVSIASQAGVPDSDDLAVIELESRSERLVLDLDRTVDTIAVQADGHIASVQRHLVVSMLLVGVGGMLTLGLLVVVGRRASRFARWSVDLTDQLAHSEDVYRTTVEALPDGVAILDDSAEVVDINSAGRRLLARHRDRFDADAPVGHPSSLTFLNERGRPVADADRPSSRALHGGETVLNEVLGVPTDEGTRWVRCNAAPIDRAPDENPWAIVTFADITEERRLAEHLAAEEARFRLAMQHAPIGIALVEGDGTFVDVNQSLCDLVGRPSSELIGLTFRDITHPDHLDADEAQMNRLLAGRADSCRTETRFLTPGGEPVDVLLAVSIVRRLGAGPYFIAEVVDLRDRKRAERAQQQAIEQQLDLIEQLRSLDIAKNQFVSTVSHELRTPLTSTMGYLELVIDGTAGPIDDRQRELLEVALRQGLRLQTLIEDLLLVAQLENHEVTAHIEPVDVGALIDAVGATIRPLAGQKGIHLDTRVDPDCPIVEGDVVQLERAVLNIANNAVKFTPPGGRVEIVASCDGGDRLVIEVTDTGVGIPEADQARVFERFYRTQQAYSDATPGSGLGLSISAEIVRLLDGTIEISSEERVGTTVTVAVPSAQGLREEPQHLADRSI